MLSANEIRKVTKLSGARDMRNVEIDVVLTYLLQLFHEQGLTEHLAFKGGTLLRKMYFGQRGRLSTDLDFTCRSSIEVDELLLRIMIALEKPYHGLAFRFDREKDVYDTDVG